MKDVIKMMQFILDNDGSIKCTEKNLTEKFGRDAFLKFYKFCSDFHDADERYTNTDEEDIYSINAKGTRTLFELIKSERQHDLAEKTYQLGKKQDKTNAIIILVYVGILFFTFVNIAMQVWSGEKVVHLFLSAFVIIFIGVLVVAIDKDWIKT